MTPKSGRNIKTPKKKTSDKPFSSLLPEPRRHLRAHSPRKSLRSVFRHSISFPPSDITALDISIPATHFQLYLSLPASIRGKIWRFAFPTPLPQHAIPSPRPKIIFPKVTHPKLKEFTLFPQLPKDLRIAIWSFVVPPPRVHQLRLVRTKVSNNQSVYHSLPTIGRYDRCTWVSEADGASGASPRSSTSLYSSAFNYGEQAGPPITLTICKESRAFTQGIFSQSYVYERWRSWAAQTWGWRRVWVHREDSFYFSRREYKFLTKDGSSPVVRHQFAKDLTRKLLIEMRMRKSKREVWNRLEGEEAPTEEETLRAAEKDLEEQVIKNLTFWYEGKGLKEFSLVIDGRFPYASVTDENNHSEEFVEPTSACEDHFVNDGRQQVLDLFDTVIQRIRDEHPELQMPTTCKIMLMTNGTRKRRRILWDYHNGRATDEWV